MAWLFRRAQTPGDPGRLPVRHGAASYDVEIRRRPGARRMTLRVSAATGAVTLTIPERVRIEQARRFAEDHAGWIAQRVTRLPERVGLGAGSEVPVRGERHLIVHDAAAAARRATRIGTDGEGRPVVLVGGDEAGVPGRVRRFLTAEAGRDLRAAVGRHVDTLGSPFPRITLRDTRSRWGSCSATGALSFSWRLILAPPLVLDYLAAHEVAHLRELNHSQRFWRLVHALCPDTADAEAWLKRHGPDLHRYG